MKPKRFSVGQEITPLKDKWIECDTGLPYNGPKPGQIYTVYDYDNFIDGSWFIRLNEAHRMHAFNEDRFVPVITTSELESELKELENVTI